MIVFINDVLVYSRSEEEHEQHLRAVLQTLREHRLFVKFNKCEFWLERVQFLGHVIFDEGIQVDPTKVEVVVSSQRLRNATEIRNFLGLAGYYRHFVQNFSSIAAPLTRLRGKVSVFSGT